MIIEISSSLLSEIQSHGETTFPEEGAGLLFGNHLGNIRKISSIMIIGNARESQARNNRYLITPRDMLNGENEAEKLGLEIVGVFHSHPNHPNIPSNYDREWALPWFSYIITRVDQGVAIESRSWRLDEDRSAFIEEIIKVEKA